MALDGERRGSWVVSCRHIARPDCRTRPDAGLASGSGLPALAGAILGTPLGVLLYGAVRHGSTMTYPPAWWLACVVIATPLAVGVLTAIPSRAAARAGLAPALQSGAA
jgi:putative ABC transport system permease protein